MGRPSPAPTALGIRCTCWGGLMPFLSPSVSTPAYYLTIIWKNLLHTLLLTNSSDLLSDHKRIDSHSCRSTTSFNSCMSTTNNHNVEFSRTFSNDLTTWRCQILPQTSHIAKRVTDGLGTRPRCVGVFIMLLGIILCAGARADQTRPDLRPDQTRPDPRPDQTRPDQHRPKSPDQLDQSHQTN